MLPTPSTSHVSFDTIYEPAEDSFLLLDTLSSASETTWLRAHFGLTASACGTAPAPTTVTLLEVGTGSGVVIAFLTANAAAIFGTQEIPILSLGVDVNSNACTATSQTVSRAVVESGSKAIYLGSICADLCSTIRSGSVDVLVFNPPYVPTVEVPTLPSPSPVSASPSTSFKQDKYATESHLLSLSYAGGRDGMETTDRLLMQIPDILSSKGVAYVLLCKQNRPEEVKARIRAWDRDQNGGSHGEKWCAETVGTSGKTAGWEKLEIVRIWREMGSGR